MWRRLRNEDVWLITRKGPIKGDLKMFSVGDLYFNHHCGDQKLCKAKQAISFTLGSDATGTGRF